MSQQSEPQLKWSVAKPLVEVALDENLATILTGPPGAGKTSLPIAIGRERGWPVYILTGSLVEPSDILGLPVRVNDPNRAIVDWAPIGVLRDVLDSTGDAILVIDDAGHMRTDSQAAAWPIIAERRVGSRPLPDGVRVVLTANRSGDLGAGARMMLTPLVSRAVLRICVLPDQRSTLKYILDKYNASDWVKSVVADAMTIDEGAFNRASPREWEYACKWIAATEKHGLAIPQTLHGAWPIASCMNIEETLKGAIFGMAVAKIAKSVVSEITGEIEGILSKTRIKELCNTIDPKTTALAVARVVGMSKESEETPNEAIAEIIRKRIGGGISSIEIAAAIEAERAMARSRASGDEASKKGE